MTGAHLHSELDLRNISFKYSKFIFRKFKCLYTDQMNTKKQIVSSVIVISITEKILQIFNLIILRVDIKKSEESKHYYN